MSDYRFQIVEHNDTMCLHVIIDAEPIAECYIPLEDIQRAKDREIVETLKELKAILQPQKENVILINAGLNLMHDGIEKGIAHSKEEKQT